MKLNFEFKWAKVGEHLSHVSKGHSVNSVIHSKMQMHHLVASHHFSHKCIIQNKASLRTVQVMSI